MSPFQSFQVPSQPKCDDLFRYTIFSFQSKGKHRNIAKPDNNRTGFAACNDRGCRDLNYKEHTIWRTL